MKINLTQDEAIDIISKHLNLPAGVTITISRPRYEISNNLDPALKELIRTIDTTIADPSQKISNIKTYRIATNTGLLDAKTAVEKWSEVKKFIRKNNKFPTQYIPKVG